MNADLVPDDWYNPDISNPEFGIYPIDIDVRREIYRAFLGLRPAVPLPLRAVAERLADSSWLFAAAGYWMFNAACRAVIDEVVWPGEVRWLPLEIRTPSGLIDDYQILAPPLDPGDFLHDGRTTRDPRGAPIRWVLDEAKVGDRQLIMVPGVTVAALVLRGRVLQRLLDCGARGIDIRRARVAD